MFLNVIFTLIKFLIVRVEFSLSCCFFVYIDIVCLFVCIDVVCLFVYIFYINNQLGLKAFFSLLAYFCIFAYFGLLAYNSQCIQK